MEMKTYFVYDKETGYILSGFDCCVDDHKDGHNIYTRPYTCKDLHPKNENCTLDYIFNYAKQSGLTSLKYENLTVGSADHPYDIKCEFIKNPNYLSSYKATRGWWKLSK
jgi:hypothetical protein